MPRLDWADQGIFDISDLSDEEFKSHFNKMTQAEKQAILDDLDDETESAEVKAKAVAFIERLGRFAMKAIDYLA